MGWENVFHCEWNDFGKSVLQHYWPLSKSYTDITKTNFKEHYGTIDILTGGFPCQPYSQAGKRLGTEDDRHLWPEMLRAIQEISPSYIVGENVLGIVNWNGGLVFNEVQTDLEAEGYEIQPVVLPACSVGALHRRDRTWFVAYSKHNRIRRWKQQQESEQKENTTITNSIDKRLQEGCNQFRQEYELFINAPDDFARSSTAQLDKTKRSSGNVSKNDGIPEELDGITVSKWKKESIKAYGNAIVPQVAFEIFNAIKGWEKIIKTEFENETSSYAEM